MSDIDTPAPHQLPDEPRGFRPSARRRNRLAAGVALGAIAIGGNIAVYSALNSSEPAVQVVRDVAAGDVITSDMLRTVDVNVDATVNVIEGADLMSLVGQYARVRLVSGSLVTRQALQAGPLVSIGNAVVAFEVDASELPVGVRERVPVRLVIPADRSDDDQTPVSIDGRVVGFPTASDSGVGTVSVSVELDDADAAVAASADHVRVVLLVPSPDPAAAGLGE
jgi:hypothetical protein